MIALIPKSVPPLSVLLDDLGNPHPSKIAAALDVTPRTVRRWLADDEAPLPVLLSLFWVSRWGFGLIACEAHNSATLYASYVGSLKSENEALRAEIARVLALRGTGAANMPSWRHLPVASVTPMEALTGS